MEGVGLILSLKASCKRPDTFSHLLLSTLTVISLFMVVFGSAGYWAFGDNTLAPITLNMTSSRSATFVKCALCLGLYLTYPIMMFPIWTICETAHPIFAEQQPQPQPHGGTGASGRGGGDKYRIVLRGTVVVVSAWVAYGVPNFGKFLSLVGSSICTLLGFVFPMYFHLYVLGRELPVWQRVLDVLLLFGGVVFGVLGTWQSLLAMMQGELDGDV
jgi:proton-coupled amino acid transporter